jgi:hypothetical protein
VDEKEAAKMLGLAENQFAMLGLKAASGSGCPRMYERAAVERLVGSHEVTALRPKRREWKRRDTDYWDAYFRHNEVDWRSSLADTCARQATLDRYTRGSSCSGSTRDEVMRTRRMLVRTLCVEGRYLVDTVDTCEPGKTVTCSKCKLNGAACWKCGGRGWRYLLRQWTDFRFVVDGRRFEFRLRTGAVESYLYAGRHLASAGWGPLDPVVYPKRSFTEAKQCIRWMLDEHLRDLLRRAAAKSCAKAA